MKDDASFPAMLSFLSRVLDHIHPHSDADRAFSDKQLQGLSEAASQVLVHSWGKVQRRVSTNISFIPVSAITTLSSLFLIFTQYYELLCDLTL